MKPRALRPLLVLGLSSFCALSGCGGASASTSGNTSAVPITAADMHAEYLTTGDEGADSAEGSSPGSMRLKASVCDGRPELRPEFKTLRVTDLAQFLEAQQFKVTVSQARGDLYYFQVAGVGGEKPLLLRVAVLGSAYDAGRELHEAVLQHGSGSWGVHRSNLAVLAPIGSPGQIVGVAVKTKLACWGVLTIAGRDDDFVVPGGYTEL